MTDEIAGTQQIESSAPVETSQPAAQDNSSDNGGDVKTLHQHQINDIARKAREAGYHKGKEEALRDRDTSSRAVETSHVASSGMGGMQQLTPEKIQQMIHDASEKLVAQQNEVAQAKQTVTQFLGKLERGLTKYENFDKKLAKINLSKIPQVVNLANMVDNTEDVMHDFAENPMKLAQFQILAMNHPEAAAEEMYKLSASIKQNQDAQNYNPVSPPLSHIKASPVGLSDGSAGDTSVRKFRNKYRA